ncbi:MAG: conjugal transfer protein TrbG, partial [Sulfitobacter sp.]|nr:conjugal transfer protein TrbG [Sulfitobacter sp.]
TVNSQQIEDGVMRVSGVSGQWVLRLGDEVVCIQVTSNGGVGS